MFPSIVMDNKVSVVIVILQY